MGARNKTQMVRHGRRDELKPKDIKCRDPHELLKDKGSRGVGPLERDIATPD
jgi:hypothetical protein